MVITHSPIERRKADHLQINLDERARAHDVTTGFERVRFVHQALPDIDLADIDLSVTFLGRRLMAPILVSSMTGGIAEGAEINRRLARAAQAFGCAMGVGSQRAAIEDPGLERFFEVRDVAPTIPIFANLGAIQLNLGYGVEQCRRAIEMINADALILHLNPLQEALQAGGDRGFKGLLKQIERLCRSLGAPIIVKEVGWGLSEQAARQLVGAGVAALDVSGAGGTSWSYVEGQRASTALAQRLCTTFQSWGIPTLASLQLARKGAPDLPLIASGGLTTGIDAAKAIAFGADLAGFAGPLLRAASESESAVHEMLEALIEELRLSMFCTGCTRVTDLRFAEIIDISDQLVQPNLTHGR